MKCLLRSFLDDFHGGEGGGLRSLMTVLTESLSRKDCTTDHDLIDCCAEALSICLEASAASRSMVASASLCLGVKDIRDLILSANSSKARRYLAEAFSRLMDDLSLFGAAEWTSIVTDSVSVSVSILSLQPLKSSGETHGAALLGGICVKILHVEPSLIPPMTLKNGSDILSKLGEELLNLDDSVGNFCADAIFLGCSTKPGNVLHERFVAHQVKLCFFSFLCKANLVLLQFDTRNGYRAREFISGIDEVWKWRPDKRTWCVEAH